MRSNASEGVLRRGFQRVTRLKLQADVHNREATFKKLDTNTDSALSLDEFKASPHAQKKPDKAQKTFGKLDKDSDGKLTLDEFKAGAHHPKKPGESTPDAPTPEAPKTEEPKKTV